MLSNKNMRLAGYEPAARPNKGGEKAMEEKKCGSGHEQHICALAEKKKLGEIKELVIDPKFMCSNCGRASHLEENLCSPMPLMMIDPGIPLE